MKISERLSADSVLETLESDCENSVDFLKRQVAFCARWSLDNLCKSSVELACSKYLFCFNLLFTLLTKIALNAELDVTYYM